MGSTDTQKPQIIVKIIYHFGVKMSTPSPFWHRLRVIQKQSREVPTVVEDPRLDAIGTTPSLCFGKQKMFSER
ncbi:MAG: hypothetical protein A2469_04655 [Candidatus Magasanikbacteria bacterium RIFOXYC2_FULL_40_16]|uniref:Uncharacterized protein n=2 Tax=Candidatus Magasanikiibacteriota TaxID=1752731 RepID=A0A1F6NZJ0_9BACT|nr:MAG: hypothetical protein A2206_00075 [Candidatus Magasanikbacteria bacterium RIFOXYA1_FULL_40_8]OGH89326.1 MAG: hypothetical protein A2469_04655 [Candidatus Magasanikbacteria bacterium RIFOXYC2_FULL_40_16]